VKGIPGPPGDCCVPTTAEVAAGVPDGIPAAFALDFRWPSRGAFGVVARKLTTDRRRDPRHLKQQNKQRLGTRLSVKGVETDGIRFCSTIHFSGSRHNHFGQSSSQTDLLISSVSRRNCPGKQRRVQPSATAETITEKPRGDSSSKTQMIV